MLTDWSIHRFCRQNLGHGDVIHPNTPPSVATALINDFNNSTRPKNQNKTEEKSAAEFLKGKQWFINALKMEYFHWGITKLTLIMILKIH